MDGIHTHPSLDVGKSAAVPDWHLPVLCAGEDCGRRAM